ncbi:ThiF family adenylyltransferase [Sphingomonas parva]|uniref:ThiF family adenylyltransferase n=1 Tax=Sphingomonas parva TaxID=2555898 RepID=A0A4Y8ZV76_9SPHN|nr:ThiF family adenylyltransferase [Sphingomonas parva]TFI59377.1 ThiF family adenylyltransferase [Sphingomonas parva]
MSAALISRDPHLKRLSDEGFEIEVCNSHLIVRSVPHVTVDGNLARGVLTCALSLDGTGLTATPQGDHTMYFAGGTPCHRNGAPMANIINNSQKQRCGELDVDHYLSSKPEVTHRYENIYDKVVAYERLIGGAARSLDLTANARTHAKAMIANDDSPFAIPDSASARYRIGGVNRKLKGRVAIIGLGGTGSFLLDLLAKTWVTEIHLYDGDQLLNHNLFRSPGSPEPELLKDFPYKVAYYAQVYARMHTGITPHPVRVTEANVDELAGFDFVFVCVDKGSSRREIANGLLRLEVPFVDTGIGVGLEEDCLDGCARATFIRPGMAWSEVERLLPFGDDKEEDDLYRTDIQIAAVNSLNAIMAIMRWKRWSNYFRDERNEVNSVYMIEGNNISNRAA